MPRSFRPLAPPRPRRRFPPTGPAEWGTAFFHGGSERWPARIGGGAVFVEVTCPMEGDPRQGVAMLALSRVPAPR